MVPQFMGLVIAGVYRLDDRRQSEQIFSSVPDKVLSLAVKKRQTLYCHQTLRDVSDPT